MYVFAFSHKGFKRKQPTSVFRAAVDAFNIFDLFIEVWKTMKWLFLAVILRRPYVRNPEDGKFDIYDASRGKRDIAVYSQVDSYAMIDVPSDHGRATPDPMLDEESRISRIPTGLRAGGKKFRDDDYVKGGKDFSDEEGDVEGREEFRENNKNIGMVEDPEDPTLPPPPSYTNMYGDEKQ